MTQNEKDLLIKDLCTRLPYGIKVEYENETFDVEHVCPMYEEVKLDIPETWTIGIDEVKPYLFPLSSMTEKQWKELTDLQIQCGLQSLGSEPSISPISISDIDTIDWLDKNHFDYRGLIPMGLANDATGLNIY